MYKISVAKGGILVEEKMFRWEIKNFNIILQNEELLEVVDAEFDFTDSNGIKSCWRFWFNYDYPCSKNDGETDESGGERDKVVMLNYELLVKQGYCSEMNMEMLKKCEDTVGTKIFDDSSTECNCLDDTNARQPNVSCRHSADDYWYEEINNLNPKKDPGLIDGTLIVLITLKAFTKISTIHSEEVQTGKTLNNERFSQIIAKLENDEENSDVKLISSDGQEFFAYRWILSEASVVFEAMFRTGMKENQTREVKLPNLSGPTVRLLLHFIYTSELGNEWSAPGVVEEFIEAADQYQIKPLKDLLDASLGKICTTENAGKLLELAERMSLKKAGLDILTFVRAKCNQPQGFFDIFKRAKLN